jgi:hypothetical protein
MPVRLGELLVRRGLLTEPQVTRVLEQQAIAHRPFGLLAETMFGVTPRDVEQVWAEQYESITGTVELASTRVEADVLDAVSRRQAWQFSVLPIRFDRHELVLATTRENLPRALRFALNVLERPAYFLLADADDLGRALARHYPLAGFGAETLAA